VTRPAPQPVAARVARHRASGVRVDVVLTDPEVIAAWRVLCGRTRSQREAVALAVILAAADVTGADRGPA
jgi:hypothetical protein